MQKTAIKVTMSIPDELYKHVEKARKKEGKTRSAVMQDALRYWLKQQEQMALVQQYQAGYRKKPESRSEVRAATAAAVQLIASEEW
jgi:metal-responsive CopG/Arc/MetJ family transcriptional regulator